MGSDFEHHIDIEDSAWIADACERLHPVQIAEELEELEDASIYAFLVLAPPRERATVFTEFQEETQDRLVGIMSPRDLARIVTFMSHDERADLVNRLSGRKMRVLLPALSYAEREDIRRLASYPE